MKRLALITSLCVAASGMASASQIERACLTSDRPGVSRALCGCIQDAANITLSSKDQRLAASFFSDPQRSQVVRKSDTRQDDAFWERYRTAIRARSKLGEGDAITLMDFLEWVEELPDGQRDIHWRSQVRLLRPEVFHYHFIGRLERFDKDFLHVLKCLNVPNPERWLQGRENTTQNVQNVELAEETRELIARIYSEDFTAFNYS